MKDFGKKYRICIGSQMILKLYCNKRLSRPLTKIIPLKLFLGIVPSSSSDITRALRGCFRKGSVYMYVVSFRLEAKGKLQCCGDVFLDILITS